jgi:hypothetical protein
MIRARPRFCEIGIWNGALADRRPGMSYSIAPNPEMDGDGDFGIDCSFDIPPCNPPIPRVIILKEKTQ